MTSKFAPLNKTKGCADPVSGDDKGEDFLGCGKGQFQKNRSFGVEEIVHGYGNVKHGWELRATVLGTRTQRSAAFSSIRPTPFSRHYM